MQAALLAVGDANACKKGCRVTVPWILLSMLSLAMLHNIFSESLSRYALMRWRRLRCCDLLKTEGEERFPLETRL